MGEGLSFPDLVKEDYIIADLDAVDKNEALQKMASELVRRGNTKPSFVEAILERERHHPSGLPMEGPAIAIPHTDAEHVNESVILFARLSRPVVFSAMGEPETELNIQLISMFALKEKKLIGDLLLGLINVYQHGEVLEAIIHAADTKEIYTTLEAAVLKYGG